MIVVDASVWVAWFVASDRHHEPTSQWIQPALRSGEILATPDLAITEVAGAIARRTNRPAVARAAVNRLLGLPTVEIHWADEQRFTLSIATAADLRLRGADAIYVALAHHLAAPLLTWDRELLSRARPLVQTLPPA